MTELERQELQKFKERNLRLDGDGEFTTEEQTRFYELLLLELGAV
ncbi:hypothetical protein Q7W37_09105 [Streptococcus suis]|nr:hypothetical protein [Streptococcus suis]